MAQKRRIGLARNKCCSLNVTCCGFRFSTKVRDKARRDIRDRTGEGSFVSSSVASEVMVRLGSQHNGRGPAMAMAGDLDLEPELDLRSNTLKNLNNLADILLYVKKFLLYLDQVFVLTWHKKV
ncbi:hypothetical protein F2Q70_00028448 [Brassica cretica]|uniref:Uncharacterized protein n=1 Tax=Brassica cretica TaxID=69181 RepID=A0A8S9LB43_BRACR|nr:hypothetical protein F2Q70_00028448 [Brassica cretica]